MIALTSRQTVVATIAAATVYGIALAVFKWVPQYDCIVFIVLLGAIFRLLDRVGERARTMALYAVTQIFVMAFVVHLWTVGYEGRNAIFGGILPWSDSFDYYDDALRLAHGDRLTEFSSKRPLFGSVLASILRVGNLRVALFVCAVAGAAAVAMVALEVWKTHGVRTAFVVYVLFLFFERHWAGFVQTEHVGMPLGAIGFALLWRANARRKEDGAASRRLALVGIFSITMALMARSGSFFVLPALCLWVARTFSAPSEKRITSERVRLFGYAASAALLGFAFHKTILFADGSGVTFSDYPGIMYGIIHTEDFTYLGQKHPELWQLGVAERVPAAWNIVLGDFAAHPLSSLGGLATSGAGLFTTPQGLFSFVWINPDDHVLDSAAMVRASMDRHGIVGPLVLWQQTLGTYSLLNAGAMGVFAATFVLGSAWAVFVAFVRKKDDEDLSLFRHAIIGVFLSAPFLPPWITIAQQLQSATFGFVAVFPAVVLLKRSATTSPRESRDRLSWAPFAFAGVLAVFVAGLRVFPEKVPICDASTKHFIELEPATAVEVAATRSMVFRKKSLGDLRASIDFLAKHNSELTDSIAPYLDAPAGTVYVSAFDACDRRAKILVDDRRLLDLGSPAWHVIEATPLASPNVLRVLQVPVEP